MRRESDNLSNLPMHRQENQANELVAYDPYANATVPSDEIDLRQLWRVITKYKGTIISVLVLSIITAAAATLLMRPVYRAGATLEIKPESGRILKFQSLEQADYQPLEYKTTQQNILVSESVAEAVIEKLELTENPEMGGTVKQRGFASGIRQIIMPLIETFKDGGQVSEQHSVNTQELEILGRFRERLTVTPIKRSDLFRVSFDSFTPELSAQVANSVVDEYIRLNQSRRFGSTSGARDFLQREIAKVQAKLEASEIDLTEYARENQIIDVEDKDDIMTSRLSDINTQLTLVNTERLSAEAEYGQAGTSNGVDSLPMVLQNDLIQQMKGEFATLQGEYFKLSEIYKPAYPRLVQIKAELDRIESSISLETQRIVNGLKTKYEQLVEKEKLLQVSLDNQKTELLSLKDRSVQYNTLKREWETNKELYTGLLERMKEVGVAAGMEINNISLIDRARIPVVQFKPNLKLNVLIAASVGLLIGVGLAFLLSFLDNTVRSPEELERYLGIANLGLIPKYAGRKTPSGSGSENTDPNLGLELICLFERNNEVSEAFRSVRTSLMFSSPKGLPKVLQVTSTGPGEGKTTVSTNLATVLADNGASVVLVDADLRKPRVHKVFKVPSAPGLSEVLTNQVDEIPVRTTPVPGLSLIASGTPPPNPAELLGSAPMDKFLEKLAQSFDHVIVDSAPLMGLADSVIVSTKVGGVIYTVHSGEINRDSLKEGVKRLRNVRAPLLGAILNQVDLDGDEYGYYGEQYFQYGSSPEDQEYDVAAMSKTARS